jgi:hypothetical protein
VPDIRSLSGTESTKTNRSTIGRQRMTEKNSYREFLKDLLSRYKFDPKKHLSNRLGLLKGCPRDEDTIKEIREIEDLLKEK